jgi:fatty-acyl-CoA synthase
MGDAGYLDQAGYLFLCDRINDTIIVGGQNIYPAEIENALSEHTGLLEATIIGVPDPQWGETVCALVVPKDGVSLTDGDIVSFLQERLASYKKPRHVVFMDSLPRNPSGKVMKRELRERFRDLGQARGET